MAGNSLLIVIGAVLGVLAVLFVYVIRELWTLTALSLFKRWRYRGVNISGEWQGLGAAHTPAAGEWIEVILALKQDTVDVGGLMMIRNRSAGNSFDLNLQAAGRISQGHVTLNLWPVSKADTSAATALLKAEQGALTGQLLFRNPLADTIDVINVSVYQAESVAMPRLRPASGPAPVGAPAQGAAAA